MSDTLDTENVVRERYSAAAETHEPALCCPIEYDRRYLEVIPQEVIDRDYGCGDPSKYVRGGETVLDLGSGGGKICFIASQVVGPTGRVIGVDMNDTMLELARRSQSVVAQRIGYDNIDFRKGRIQDMTIDRDVVDAYLKENPVVDEASLQRFESYLARLRDESPMIADESVDVVVSNCVLNLVSSCEKAQLFDEIYRVLRPGGRAVISDIVSDEPVPEQMQNDPQLWSGCISGALQEREFLEAFVAGGFHGVHMPLLQADSWRTVDGIEFRSTTVIAYKGKEGPCLEHNEAVIYRGPFKRVHDDDGHIYERGKRTAICRKTFKLLTSEPYAESFIPVEPRIAIDPEVAKPFPCDGGRLERSPRVTKGEHYKLTQPGDDCCGPGGCC